MHKIFSVTEKMFNFYANFETNPPTFEARCESNIEHHALQNELEIGISIQYEMTEIEKRNYSTIHLLPFTAAASIIAVCVMM